MGETVIQGEIRQISGFTGTKNVCPECGRETDESFCAVHAEVQPDEKFSISVKVEDKDVQLGKAHFNKIVGLDPEKVEALPQNEKMNLIKSKLRGAKIRVVGNEANDKFYAKDVDLIRG
jgi:hypothetical protein